VSTVLTNNRNARVRGKNGPRAKSKVGLISRAQQLGWSEEQIAKLRAEYDIIRALELIEAGERELAEAATVGNSDLDYDAIVADWPELSAATRDRLALLLKGGK
jgi:hypothetical protein